MGSNGPETKTTDVPQGDTGPGAVGPVEVVAAGGDTAEGADVGLCPFCGGHSIAGSDQQCGGCGARTDLLSRQATQNEMGPWFVRDETAPFRPGCRLETIERWARSGRIHAGTVMRGPSTHQNWVEAKRVPGVSGLFGVCHACGGSVDASEVICGGCGAGLTAERDRQHLGLSEVRPLPGRAPASVTAGSLIANGAAPRGEQPGRDAVHQPVADPVPLPTPVARGVGDSREALFGRHLARAKRAAVIATVVAVVSVSAMVAVLLGVRFGVIQSVRPAAPVAAPAAEGDAAVAEGDAAPATPAPSSGEDDGPIP